jgi:hypothetical protein
MHRKRSGVLAAGWLLAGIVAGTMTLSTASFAQNKGDSAMPKVGDVAPDFKLQYFDGNDLKDVKLSDYRGKKNVVVAFYIFAFTGG